MSSESMFSSESVTEGHPDKLCDQISDAIVDAYLQQDPLSEIVAECAVATGILFVATRFASEASVDIPGLARDVVREIGYDDASFDASSCSVMTSLNQQSHRSRVQVAEEELDDGELDRIVAEDQATLFGFACRQTPSLLPLPIALAHKLARRLYEVRRDGTLPYLAPDGKTQVGVAFRDRRPTRIHSLSVVASHGIDSVPALPRMREEILEQVVQPVFEDELLRPDAHTHCFVNPGGEVVFGGPALHAGLTGRKTAVDTYGEYARHSGAALSGKGPRRIDRVAAYAARHIAVNVVAARLADECEVTLSYTIGQARPVSVSIETFGSGTVPDEEIARRVTGEFDLRVASIVARFGLRRAPGERKGRFFRALAAYGQVGRREADLDLPWERADRVDALR